MDEFGPGVEIITGLGGTHTNFLQYKMVGRELSDGDAPNCGVVTLERWMKKKRASLQKSRRKKGGGKYLKKKKLGNGSNL